MKQTQVEVVKKKSEIKPAFTGVATYIKIYKQIYAYPHIHINSHTQRE